MRWPGASADSWTPLRVSAILPPMGLAAAPAPRPTSASSAQGPRAPSPPDGWPRTASPSSCWSGASGPTARRCGPGSRTSSCGRVREWLWRPDDRAGCRGPADRRARLRRLGADVERRRRLDGPVRGAVASQHAVRLPAALDRGHRGRLAADLRGARAVLPADRAGVRHLRVSTAIRPSRAPTIRCRRCGCASGASASRGRTTTLGWHWWPGSNAIATRPYGRLRACTDRGSCMFGCPERGEVLAGSHALAGRRSRSVCGSSRARTRSGSRPIARGRATGVVYVGPDGGEHRQRAKVVIVAANAVGTPWLLLVLGVARATRKGWPTRAASSAAG